MGARVERAGVDDWARVRAIRLRALAGEPDAFGSTLAREVGQPEPFWRERLGRADAATFLVVEDGHDVGLATGATYDSARGDGGLFSMWVDPPARGRGHGRRLVDAVATWAEAAGHARLVLDVGDLNASAVALYAACGFVPTGTTGTADAERMHIKEHQRALALPRRPTTAIQGA